MNESHEYNYRQIILLEKKIDDFKNKKISLYYLISDLFALLTCIKDVKKAWLDKFSSFIGRLDTVNAIALDREQTEFNDYQIQEINECISQMNHLIADYKKENKYGNKDIL